MCSEAKESFFPSFCFCVTAESCYASFHDEEWGVPVRDDKYATINCIIFLKYFFQSFRGHKLCSLIVWFPLLSGTTNNLQEIV